MIMNQPNVNQQPGQKKFNKSRILRIIIDAFVVLSFFLFGLCMYFVGNRNNKKVAVDFTCIDEAIEAESKYKFLNSAVSDYICNLSSEVDIDSDLVVAILMVENPEFDPDATHRNENGTIDVGMFQLNDRYIWTTFKDAYWFDNIELDPFNWKHNTYIAVHHLEQLQKKLKITEDVIMAYNCGIGAVMNETVPAATKVYLAKVKNNMVLLKGAEE